MDNKNKNDHANSRKEIMKGPASRASRLKRQEIRNRDDRKISRFGEWMLRRETPKNESGSETAYDLWRREFTKKFLCGQYKGNLVTMDRDNLFAGRITWVLDELGGEYTGKFWDYVGGVNVSEQNYYKLLDELVRRDHPEMLRQWIEDGSGRDD